MDIKKLFIALSLVCVSFVEAPPKPVKKPPKACGFRRASSLEPSLEGSKALKISHRRIAAVEDSGGESLEVILDPIDVLAPLFLQIIIDNKNAPGLLDALITWLFSIDGTQPLVALLRIHALNQDGNSLGEKRSEVFFEALCKALNAHRLSLNVRGLACLPLLRPFTASEFDLPGFLATELVKHFVSVPLGGLPESNIYVWSVVADFYGNIVVPFQRFFSHPCSELEAIKSLCASAELFKKLFVLCDEESSDHFLNFFDGLSLEGADRKACGGAGRSRSSSDSSGLCGDFDHNAPAPLVDESGVSPLVRASTASAISTFSSPVLPCGVAAVCERVSGQVHESPSLFGPQNPFAGFEDEGDDSCDAASPNFGDSSGAEGDGFGLGMREGASGRCVGTPFWDQTVPTLLLPPAALVRNGNVVAARFMAQKRNRCDAVCRTCAGSGCLDCAFDADGID